MKNTADPNPLGMLLISQSCSTSNFTAWAPAGQSRAAAALQLSPSSFGRFQAGGMRSSCAVSACWQGSGHSCGFRRTPHAEVRDLWAAGIIHLPSGSGPATPFFSEPSGTDKLVWWWQCSHPPLSLPPSPWMRASYRNQRVTTGNRLQNPWGHNHPCWPFFLGFPSPQAAIDCLRFMDTWAVVVWLPVHGIATEHMDHMRKQE